MALDVIRENKFGTNWAFYTVKRPDVGGQRVGGVHPPQAEAVQGQAHPVVLVRVRERATVGLGRLGDVVDGRPHGAHTVVVVGHGHAGHGQAVQDVVPHGGMTVGHGMGPHRHGCVVVQAGHARQRARPLALPVRVHPEEAEARGAHADADARLGAAAGREGPGPGAGAPGSVAVADPVAIRRARLGAHRLAPRPRQLSTAHPAGDTRARPAR